MISDERWNVPSCFHCLSLTFTVEDKGRCRWDVKTTCQQQQQRAHFLDSLQDTHLQLILLLTLFCSVCSGTALVQRLQCISPSSPRACAIRSLGSVSLGCRFCTITQCTCHVWKFNAHIDYPLNTPSCSVNSG
ncbi:hypothetical protein TYRP_013139 [Tyrophagus putrescentiae]|nr:hypothetical protein TYRP_013139 [Tyrophagus putrescentiae]